MRLKKIVIKKDSKTHLVQKILNASYKLAVEHVKKDEFRHGVKQYNKKYYSWVSISLNVQPTVQILYKQILSSAKVKINKNNSEVIKYTLARACTVYSETVDALAREKLNLYGRRTRSGKPYKENNQERS